MKKILTVRHIATKRPPIIIDSLKNKTVKEVFYKIDFDTHNIIPVINKDYTVFGLIEPFNILKETYSGKIAENKEICNFIIKKYSLFEQNTHLFDINLENINFPIMSIDSSKKYCGIIQKEDLLDLYFNELRRVKKGFKNFKKNMHFLEMVFENVLEQIVIVDDKALISYANKKFLNLFNVTFDEAIGMNILDVTKKGILQKVVKTGKRETIVFSTDDGQEFLVNNIPVKENNYVIAGVGMGIFKNLNDLKQILNKLDILEGKVNFYKNELKNIWQAKYTFDDIVGESERLKFTKETALKAAKNDLPVLLIGESGTGKELFAHAIHRTSPRMKGDFIRVNCSAIPRDLLESELFGYEPGAFTGAGRKAKPGKFEMADGGTIFLDEIGDMPFEMQTKLLRVLQEKEFERVGGLSPIKVNFRAITATNHKLEELVKEGIFREDLFFRLNVLRIEIVPLRERREDIPILIKEYLKRNSLQKDREFNISDDALELLYRYNWPGNVRELFNILSYLINFINDNTVHMSDLPDNIINFNNKEDEVGLDS
ncbi:MAG: sigma 54-interacting transcriptional regulator, partial [Thermodesulfobacteriota bacterium]|nr:sigma 54-interacting transcriptional regulator [Thermodesulfobacteriota bacterium]